MSSVLFTGYKCLGLYASRVPFSLVRSDEDWLLCSAVGQHAFYVYDTRHLNCVYASRYIAEQIGGV